MLSMKDIAKLSGVSVKTVSRVLNNSPQVKEETKEKVLAVVEKEGYHRNIIAKSLKEQKTRTIIVFIDRHSGNYWGIWHTIILREFMVVAKENSYKIIIAPSSADSHMADETDGFGFLSSGLADGAILMDNINFDKRIEYLNKFNIPHVVLGNCGEDAKSHWVDNNNYKACYSSTNYLIEKGYKSIAFLLGGEDFKVNQERAKGFIKAMEDAGVEDYTIEYEINSMKKAYNITKKHIDEKKKVDAYFVSGDERAIGVYRALQENGKKIPEDVAVLGIDNIPHAKYLYPSLSSVEQPIDDLAKQAVEMLVALIEGEEDVQKNVQVDYRLVEREST